MSSTRYAGETHSVNLESYLMRSVAIITTTLVLALAPAAQAWNEKGHMVVARLAWLKLSPDARTAASEILKTHPHYEEYLAADRPAEIAVDEWAFMRAGYWPDWVRSNHSEEYNHPTWHYVSVAFVPPQSKLRAADFPCDVPNVVTQISLCIEKIHAGTAAEKPLYLCWLVHLIGDIHQPLHCASLWNEIFPEGDRGGNLPLVRVDGGMPERLHFVWDALLGETAAPEAIFSAVVELDQLEQCQAATLEAEQNAHPSPADWAREGLALATEHAYLRGDLYPAHADLNPSVNLVPALSAAYVQNAQKVARLAKGLSGSLKSG
jgi:hypothetical protein